MPRRTASRNETEHSARKLQAARVSGADRRAKRVATDVGVRLEPGNAFIGPVDDDPPRFFGGATCAIVAAPPGPVRYGPVRCMPRARDFTPLDGRLHVDLVIRRRPPRGADCRDTVC